MPDANTMVKTSIQIAPTISLTEDNVTSYSFQYRTQQKQVSNKHPSEKNKERKGVDSNRRGMLAIKKKTITAKKSLFHCATANRVTANILLSSLVP